MSDKLCSMCPKAGTHKCGSCYCIKYCSRECQRSDWPVHKLVCKFFRDPSFQNSATETTKNHLYRHLVLLENGDVQCIPLFSPPTGENLEAVENCLKYSDYNTLYDGTHFKTNHVLGREIECGSVALFYRGSPFREVSRPNAVLAAVVGARAADSFRGPLVVRAYQNQDKETIHNIRPMDMRHVIDFIRAHVIDVIPPSMPFFSRRYHAVRVNCMQELQNFKRAPLELVFIRPMIGEPLHIAHALGFSLYRVLEKDSMMHVREGNDSNHYAAALDYRLSTDERFGWCGTDFRLNLSNMLVFRADGREVPTKLVHDIARFGLALQPYFARFLGKYGQDKKISRNAVLSQIKREKFEAMLPDGVGKRHYEDFKFAEK